MAVATYETWEIVDVSPDGYLQGGNDEGKMREFGLVVNRDVETGELTLGVCRHFTDPDSLAAFAGSEPWAPDEVEEEDA
jgi:hypothetical protein